MRCTWATHLVRWHRCHCQMTISTQHSNGWTRKHRTYLDSTMHTHTPDTLTWQLCIYLWMLICACKIFKYSWALWALSHELTIHHLTHMNIEHRVTSALNTQHPPSSSTSPHPLVLSPPAPHSFCIVQHKTFYIQFWLEWNARLSKHILLSLLGMVALFSAALRISSSSWATEFGVHKQAFYSTKNIPISKLDNIATEHPTWDLTSDSSRLQCDK